MVSDLEISISYSETDVKKAIAFYLLNIYGLKRYALLIYPILLGAFIFSLTLQYYLLSVIFVIFGFTFRWIYYIRPIEMYVKFYKAKKGGQYIFYNEQIEAIGEDIQSVFRWSVFTKAHETPSAFLLIDTNKFIYIFPKSCFGDVLLIDRLRVLLAAKFSEFKIYT